MHKIDPLLLPSILILGLLLENMVGQSQNISHFNSDEYDDVK